MASPKKSPKKKAVRPKKKAAKKKRTPAKKKRVASRKPSSRAKKRDDWYWWKVAGRASIILVLTALAGLTSLTFFQGIAAVKGFAFLTAAPVFFFILGMLALPVLVWGFSDLLLYLYVFGHELTHVVFIYLCGGKVFGDIRVSVTGGHVVTNKTNWVISLSPYFVPFFTVIVGTGFLLARFVVDLGATLPLGPLSFKPLYLFYTLIGFTWTMHIYYTLTMLLKNQPDLHMNGTLLSLLVIYLVNSIIVITFVTLASETLTMRGFLTDWSANAMSLWNRTLVRVAGLIW